MSHTKLLLLLSGALALALLALAFEWSQHQHFRELAIRYRDIISSSPACIELLPMEAT